MKSLFLCWRRPISKSWCTTIFLVGIYIYFTDVHNKSISLHLSSLRRSTACPVTRKPRGLGLIRLLFASMIRAQLSKPFSEMFQWRVSSCLNTANAFYLLSRISPRRKKILVFFFLPWQWHRDSFVRLAGIEFFARSLPACVFARYWIERCRLAGRWHRSTISQIFKESNKTVRRYFFSKFMCLIQVSARALDKET